MIEIITGLFIIIIVSFVAYLILPFQNISTLFSKNIFFTLFFLAFYITALASIFKGIKRILIDKKTDKKGIECYGRIISISESGTYLNGKPEYKAEFLVYVYIENITKNIYETIGFNKEKYPLGSYVKLKYYNNDINIIELIENTNNIPENILKYLDVEIDKNENIDEYRNN